MVLVLQLGSPSVITITSKGLSNVLDLIASAARVTPASSGVPFAPPKCDCIGSAVMYLSALVQSISSGWSIVFTLQDPATPFRQHAPGPGIQCSGFATLQPSGQSIEAIGALGKNMPPTVSRSLSGMMAALIAAVAAWYLGMPPQSASMLPERSNTTITLPGLSTVLFSVFSSSLPQSVGSGSMFLQNLPTSQPSPA